MQITNRTTHQVQQGTGAWLRLREGFSTASEAPAALGVSRYVTRAELLRRKHTGVAPEPDAATLGRFDAGHAAEARARPLAEDEAGGDLFPVTMTAEVDGLPLLASLDGLTMDDAICWETKLWNEELAAAVRAGDLPAHYTVQMDQELLVSGAARCLFTCTDGTPERYVSCWYEADPAKFAALLDGWRQFAADLASYVPPARAEPAQAEHMESLPAVAVRLDGALTVAGNLPSFAAALKAFIAKMPAKPTTDNDFATTDAACKALKKAEEALDAAEAGALASITDVEAMRRAVADCRKLARDTRLAAEKLVERRKVEIREQAVTAARAALDLHIAAVNAEIAPMRLQPVAADFAGAIKGKRSIDSMQDALDTLLALSKINADSQGRAIRANVQAFKAATGDDTALQALFADLGQLVHKPADDFAVVVDARIAKHLADEIRREQARQAEEAERIAAAERRAAAETEARIRAEQEAQARREREAAEADRQRLAAEQQKEFTEGRGSQQVLKAEPATADATDRDAPANSSPGVGPMGAGQPADAGPAGGNVARLQPAANEPATLTLGMICERLQFTVRADFLADVLHIAPAKVEGKRPGTYTESQFQVIVRQLQSHVSAMGELYAQQKAA